MPNFTADKEVIIVDPDGSANPAIAGITRTLDRTEEATGSVSNSRTYFVSASTFA
jgi:hypothetical protein